MCLDSLRKFKVTSSTGFKVVYKTTEPIVRYLSAFQGEMYALGEMNVASTCTLKTFLKHTEYPSGFHIWKTLQSARKDLIDMRDRMCISGLCIVEVYFCEVLTTGLNDCEKIENGSDEFAKRQCIVARNMQLIKEVE
jgi:hypothetical protein